MADARLDNQPQHQRRVSTATSHPDHRRQRRSRLLRFEELPEWLQDDHFIQTGYRPVSNSTRASLKSLGSVHNETFNIYSHLLPASLSLLAAALIADSVLVKRYPLASQTDRLLWLYYLLSVGTCFSLSAAFHTLINHSATYYHFFLKVDYCGIMILILAHFVTGEYLTFYCEHRLRNTYWTLIIFFTFLTSLIVLHPDYQSHDYRTTRVAAFTALGMSAFGPIVHSLILHDLDEVAPRSGLYWYLIEGLVVAVAVTLFVTRFPQCCMPGKFDLWGSSHQWFHVLTVGTVLIHLRGLWGAYDTNYHLRQC
ncbi:hypothetical protein CAC42_7347 [Sphaceloma murrayae]|uniref:Uncharacterized protein n=1 Tax=Sphaceloma murrayae TaxID=2082308 RepID=A0A2K1QX76_9PEZI|nr:hypothetical protein CAC42_7347 [Sphaceloma murrayae]